MPRKRWALTASQCRDYEEIQARLRDGGADLGTSRVKKATAKRLIISPCLTHSYVRRCKRASVFAVYLRLTGLAPKTVIQAIELSPPDWRLDVASVDDPKTRNPKLQHYALFDGTSFDHSEVLNHRAESGLVIDQGDLIEGWFLAQSFSSAPEYTSRFRMPVTLALTNQFLRNARNSV